MAKGKLEDFNDLFYKELSYAQKREMYTSAVLYNDTPRPKWWRHPVKWWKWDPRGQIIGTVDLNHPVENMSESITIEFEPVVTKDEK